jgi:D-alanyl-D-alanine carboxypeptidase
MRDLPPLRRIGLRIMVLGLVVLTAACAGQGRNQGQMAQDYANRAKPSYAPPGPPGDPWGPYIRDASREFDVPERWIREVMRVESGGRTNAVSPVGAMGLLQLMPGTYEELRGRYALGDDPFFPKDNIRAGTAYMREMYDRFGNPAFLAAYNAGPRGLERWLHEGRPLPAETRKYVAMIAPNVRDISPMNRTDLANYQSMPNQIAAGPRFAPQRPTRVMLAGANSRTYVAASTPSARAGVSVPAGRAPSAPAPMQVASAPPPPSPSSGSRFSLIGAANAAPVPAAGRGGARNWSVQVGAFASESLARSAANEARQKAPELASGLAFVTPVQTPRGKLFRARVGGLNEAAAGSGCDKLARQRWQCSVVSPEAQ